MALVAVHMSRTLVRLYKANGPLWVGRYLKVCKLSMYRALGGLSIDPPYRQEQKVSYALSSKLVLVSLASNGLPRIILPRHRAIMVSGQEADRWVRTYATIFDPHKLMVVAVKEVDVSSIEDDSSGNSLIYHEGPLARPLKWLGLIPAVRSYILDSPVQLGFASRLSWTAGPNSRGGLASSAMLVEDAYAFLYWYTPDQLQLFEELFAKRDRYVFGGTHQPLTSSEFASFLIQLVSVNPPTSTGDMGRVGIKAEPAGKVRLFMMLDSISQRLLQSIQLD